MLVGKMGKEKTGEAKRWGGILSLPSPLAGAGARRTATPTAAAAVTIWTFLPLLILCPHRILFLHVVFRLHFSNLFLLRLAAAVAPVALPSRGGHYPTFLDFFLYLSPCSKRRSRNR